MQNIYSPKNVIIAKIEEQSPTVKLFRLERGKGDFEMNENKMVFVPGQFVLIGKIGYGEAPFGPASSPYEKRYIEIVVRKAGIFTNHLHSLKEGDQLTLRGPYGNGFPINFMEDKDVVAVTGGCGIPPIASLLEYVSDNFDRFGRVYLLYGSKSPEEILLKDRIENWQKRGIKVILTIDKPVLGWKGHVGFVNDLVKEIEIDEINATAAMCGPGPMADAIEKILQPLGLSDRRIFVSMERKMQCGVGKCQHCTTGSKYVCMDGPVFNYDQIDKNHD